MHLAPPVGSSFLFDASVTGPAIDHFQQVPALFWGFIGATIFVIEAGAYTRPLLSSTRAALITGATLCYTHKCTG